jgi:ribosomal protein S18 acetylase RimI-like enzyme
MPKREYEIRASAPSKLPLRDLSHCTRIVRTGDAVDPDSAAVELPRSEILALASAGNLIIGVGAIKRRRPGYARQIAERSGVSFDPNTSELGYVAVDPEHRGQRLAERIVRELLAHHAAPLFATTSSERMKRTLARVGFVERGHAWPGRNGEQLSFWIKETQALPSPG